MTSKKRSATDMKGMALRYQQQIQEAAKHGEDQRKAAERGRIEDRLDIAASEIAALGGAADTGPLDTRYREVRSLIEKGDLAGAAVLASRLEAAIESAATIYVKAALLRSELKLVDLELAGLDVEAPRPVLDEAKQSQAGNDWKAAVRAARRGEEAVRGLVRQQVTTVLDDCERLIDALDDRRGDPGEGRPRTQESWALLNDGHLDAALEIALQAHRELKQRRDLIPDEQRTPKEKERGRTAQKRGR